MKQTQTLKLERILLFKLQLKSTSRSKKKYPNIQKYRGEVEEIGIRSSRQSTEPTPKDREAG